MVDKTKTTTYSRQMNYDVIITGSGPAGSTAANLLSKKGFKVLLLEKSVFPRDKVCAGGLTPKTVKLLDEIGIISKEELILDTENVKKIKGVKVFLENISYTGNFEGKFGAAVNRKHFDSLLTKQAVKAGALLIEQAAVFEPIVEKGYVCGVKYATVESGFKKINEARAKITIIAEGAASPLTRILSGFKKSHAVRAVNTVCEPKSGESGEYFEFYFEKNLTPGYFWYFPFVAKKEYAAAGFGIERKAEMKKEYARLHGKYLQGVNIVEPPKTWIIPCDYPKKIAGDGWLIAGDAAGLCNPVTGEGIYYAVKSGEFAARTAEKALHNRSYGKSFLQEYEIMIAARFKKEYNISRVIKKLFPLGFHKAFFLAAAKKKGVLEKFMSGDMDFNDISIAKILKYLFFLPFLALFVSGCGTAPVAVEKEQFYPPSRSYLHYSQGLLYSRNFMFEQAIEEFNISLALDPDSEVLNQALAAEYVKTGKNAEAQKLFSKLASQSSEPKVLLSCAEFFMNQKEFDRAVKCCQKIIAKESGNSEAYFYLGSIYYRQAKSEEAIKMFKKVIELDPKSDTAYFNLGLVSGLTGDYSAAEKFYITAWEINPEYTAPLYALGLMYQIQDKHEKAIVEYNKILALSPFEPSVYKNIGIAYGRIKKYKEAVEYLKRAVELEPADTDSLKMTAALLFQEKNYQTSLDFSKKFAAADRSNAEAYQLMGANYIELGKNDEAVKAYEKFVELDAYNPAGYIYLSYLYAKNKEQAKMVVLLEKGVKNLPDNIELGLYLGGAYFENKNFVKAEEVYLAVLKIKKDEERALYALGVLSEQAEKYKDAVLYFKKVIAINPKHADAYNYAGYIYAMRNENLEEALSLISEALKLEPDNGAYLDSLGWVYFKSGKIDEALRETERALAVLRKSGKEDPAVLEHLGDILLKKNLKEKASEMYKLSIKLLDNAGVRRKLDEINKSR